MSRRTILQYLSGVVSIADRLPVSGQPTGYLDLGNCSGFRIESIPEVSTHTENRTGRSLVDNTIETSNAKLTLTLDSGAFENLCYYLKGQGEIETSRLIANEPVTLYQNRETALDYPAISQWISLIDSNGVPLRRKMPSDQLLWVVDWNGTAFNSYQHGLPTDQPVELLSASAPFTTSTIYYVQPLTPNLFQLSASPGGVAIVGGSPFSTTALAIYDYEVNLQHGTIAFPLTLGTIGNSIADGDTCYATYRFSNIEKITAFVESTDPVSLLFRGLNQVDDEPVRCLIPRLKLDPVKSLTLVGGNDFNTFEVDGYVLYDRFSNSTITIELTSDVVVPEIPVYVPNYVNTIADALADYARTIEYVNIETEYSNVNYFYDLALTQISFANTNATALIDE